MARPTQAESEVGKALRGFARAFPEAQEGVACAGTAAEKRTVQVRKKAFVFLGATDVLVKLRDSLPEALHLAAQEPNRYRVGALGWVTVTIGAGGSAPRELLERWVDESYRLQAPQALLESLSPRGAALSAPAAPAASGAPKPRGKKPSVKKTPAKKAKRSSR
jgi:YjbR protein